MKTCRKSKSSHDGIQNYFIKEEGEKDVRDSFFLRSVHIKKNPTCKKKKKVSI